MSRAHALDPDLAAILASALAMLAATVGAAILSALGHRGRDRDPDGAC